MYERYAQEILIQYLYGELNEAQTTAIGNAIIADADLAEECRQLRRTMAELDTLKAAPHPTTIELILEHSLHHSGEMHSS